MEFFIEKLKRILGKFWFLIIIGIMACIFLTWAQSQGELTVYDTENGRSDRSVQTEKVTEKEEPMVSYDNNIIAMSMLIPEGWERITKDGFDTFVHASSASSIQIEVLDYYPMINETTEESITEDASSRGLTATEFQWQASNCYIDICQKNGTGGVTDYIEKVIWDRSHVLKVVATFDDTNYERLKSQIWKSLDSVTWNYEDPIPDGFILRYYSYGDFEFAVPSSWTGSGDDASFYAYDENTGAYMYVNVSESTDDVGSMSQIDYASALGDGRQNFVLSSFQSESGQIYAEATYMSNDVQTGVVQDCLSNGSYAYVITYEFPVDNEANLYQTATSGISVTRIFGKANEMQTDMQETETQDMQNQSSSGNSDIFDEMSGVLSGDNDNSNNSQNEIGSDQNNVSTLADAFVTVAGMSSDSAQAAQDVWSSLGLGDPYDVSAYAESDSELVVQVVNTEGAAYYLFFSKNDSSLLRITQDSQEGTIIYQAG